MSASVRGLPRVGIVAWLAREAAMSSAIRTAARWRVPGLMALSAGTRIGNDEIVAPLGSGGMGEVYRARDTRLDRTVAIKALPEGFARDAERLARFEREARLLAALDHPNIAGIYGIEDRAE